MLAMNRIVMAVVIFVLVFAAIFVFDGKYEVKYDENSFTIEAAYWEDVTVNYEDISEILGTSVGALKASFHHAVKKIESFFE